MNKCILVINQVDVSQFLNMEKVFLGFSHNFLSAICFVYGHEQSLDLFFDLSLQDKTKTNLFRASV